jgi:hypothetical protein
MIIKWGEVEFEGPYPITDWEPPNQAAVYAIMMKPYPQMKVYKFVYFGESGNLSERGFYRAHHKYDCWIREAGSEGNLYIGIHRMPDSTDEQRRKLESVLMLGPYKPACND